MLEILETPLTVLHVLAAFVLILVILIQPGKSGGLTAALGGAGTQQVFGGRGAGTFLTQATWVLSAIFFTTSIVLAYISSSADTTLGVKHPHKAHVTVPVPAAPAPAAPAKAPNGPATK